MKHTLQKTLIIALAVIPLLLSACGAGATPAPSTPPVEIGYLSSDNWTHLPTAFVDYEPGMTISAAFSPEATDPTVRHSMYKETIAYASGKTVEVEFFVVSSDENGTVYEAEIDGKVQKVPDIKDYLTGLEAKMKDKMAFTFFVNSWQQPLIKLPALCPDGAEMTENYSPFPEKDWLRSLDTITLKCPSTGKTHAFEFSYVREETGDQLIKAFTVKMNETSAQ